jgi:hypothetical protein
MPYQGQTDPLGDEEATLHQRGQMDKREAGVVHG